MWYDSNRRWDVKGSNAIRGALVSEITALKKRHRTRSLYSAM